MTYGSRPRAAGRSLHAAPRIRRRLPPLALGVAAVGAVLTIVAPFLRWATLAVGEESLTANGLDQDMNGKISIWLGVVSALVVAVLVLRAVKGLWVLLPVLGAMIVFVGWAQTRKLQNTLDATGLANTGTVSASNGPGVWLTAVGGLLLLSTLVLVPVLRRSTV